MKSKSIAAILAATMFLTACGRNYIDANSGKEYTTYGIFNEDTNKNPNMEYRVIVGNVILSILFIETAVVPILLVGFSLWEPVAPKGMGEPGVIIRN